MEAICANPLFFAGLYLALGAAGGFAFALTLIGLSCKVRR